jgi:hypothetical protein
MVKTDELILLLAFVFTWQVHELPCRSEVPADEAVYVFLEFIFSPMREKHLKMVFDRLKVFLSLFFLFDISLGIGSSCAHNERASVSP